MLLMMLLLLLSVGHNLTHAAFLLLQMVLVLLLACMHAVVYLQLLQHQRCQLLHCC